jgi:hypothetical protein
MGGELATESVAKRAIICENGCTKYKSCHDEFGNDGWKNIYLI